MFYARPSAEALLTITRSSGAARISDLRFNVRTSYIPSSSRYVVLDVAPPNAGAPEIQLSSADETGRRDGNGGFRRIYPVGRTVTLTAPPAQGSFAFKAWVSEIDSQLGTSPTLTVSLPTSRAIRPMYIASNPATSGYRLGGTVSSASSACVSGVPVSLTGAASTTQSSLPDGTYQFLNLAAGTYTVTPAKAGCVFAPLSRTLTLSADTTGQTFVGTASGSPLSDVTLLLPSNGATGISVNPVLMWSALPGTTSYDVYFGPAAVPPLVTNTSATAWSTRALIANVAYSWRIVAKTGVAVAGSSPTWSFTAANTPAVSGLYFTPVAPCRVADTRDGKGPSEPSVRRPCLQVPREAFPFRSGAAPACRQAPRPSR